MAEAKTTPAVSKEYIIPLRSEWQKVPRYKRSRRAIVAIKEYIAKHMKVPDRDLNKVKLDVYFNNDIWFRGCKKPPAKIKVKATKEEDIIRVEFAETPDYVKFLKAKHERRHKKPEKKPEVVERPVKEEERTEEAKKEEAEKGKATEIQHTKDAELKVKEQKHTIKQEKVQQPVRKALKK